MKILTVSAISGGMSHLIPLYVLHQRYLRSEREIDNLFLINSESQKLFRMQGIHCLPIDYRLKEDLPNPANFLSQKEYVLEMEKEAYNLVKPSLIIEDNAFFTPLIAEKNQVPRISIQRTGAFRSIDRRYRNDKHRHSIEKGTAVVTSANRLPLTNSETFQYTDSEFYFLQKYTKPKVKIIPGISTIERLPAHIEEEDSYFYCGPLIAMDKPSDLLSDRLKEFMHTNKQRAIVFITTGLVDKTPVEEFIEFFVKRNYAVITTCNCPATKEYSQQIFYNNLLPLNHVCAMSNLVIHQCGSGMYHYPILNRVPSLTIGTQCYDREDIALRLEELNVSGHIPHPDDNPNYWTIFLELVDRFEKNTLMDFSMVDRLKREINETMLNFDVKKAINYALT